MALNRRDEGKRRFILVEGEHYAESLTAERVRRVIGEPSSPDVGGEFTYCTLGEPIEMAGLLSGRLPDADAMAAVLWHTATATPLPAAPAPTPDVGDDVARLGSHAGRTFWLIYRPDLDWLKSDKAALSLARARAIAATAPGNHLVFAPAEFVSRELLARERIDVDYAPLPFALFRLETA